MKKFKVAFFTAFLAFLCFYIFAVVKGAHNPFGKLIGINEDIETKEEEPKKEKEIEVKIPEKPKEEYNGDITFVMMGIDGIDVNAKDVQDSRTDTMIVSRIDFNTGEVRLLNLPRDTMYKYPGGTYTKLNAGHAFGGSKLALKYINDITKLDIKNYVKVDYMAVKNLVDEIGGVKFEIPFRMKYDDTTKGKELHIDFKPGLQKIDGKGAIEFLRWRKNNPGIPIPTDGSDISRIAHQQEFIKAVLKEAVSFKNLFKLPKILRAVLPNVDTNIEIDTMLKMVASAGKLKPDEMKAMTLPGHAENDKDGISYWIMNEKEAKKMIDENFR